MTTRTSPPASASPAASASSNRSPQCRTVRPWGDYSCAIPTGRGGFGWRPTTTTRARTRRRTPAARSARTVTPGKVANRAPISPPKKHVSSRPYSFLAGQTWAGPPQCSTCSWIFFTTSPTFRGRRTPRTTLRDGSSSTWKPATHSRLGGQCCTTNVVTGSSRRSSGLDWTRRSSGPSARSLPRWTARRNTQASDLRCHHSERYEATRCADDVAYGILVFEEPSGTHTTPRAIAMDESEQRSTRDAG
jgi:hypothetical protein